MLNGSLQVATDHAHARTFDKLVCRVTILPLILMAAGAVLSKNHHEQCAKRSDKHTVAICRQSYPGMFPTANPVPIFSYMSML